jgi:hypothetical protein
MAQSALGLQFETDGIIVVQAASGLPLRAQGIVRVPIDENLISKGSVLDLSLIHI